jgi:hypothetical protein
MTQTYVVSRVDADGSARLPCSQISWGRYTQARANIDAALDRAKRDRRGLRLAITLRSSLLLEATRGGSADELEPHLRAYIAHQRSDRFSLNGPMIRAAAAAAPWLHSSSRLLTGCNSLEELPEADRSALLTTARACVAVVQEMSRLSVPRIVQAAHVFLHFDVIAQFWCRIVPFLAAAADPTAAQLGRALTEGIQGSLAAFRRAVDPFTMGAGLTTSLFWTAVIPDVLKRCAWSHGANILQVEPLASTEAADARLALLRRALAVAEARHELPMVARIRNELALLETRNAAAT